LYLLDANAEAAEGAEPSLPELGRSTLELLDSTFAPLRTSSNTVLVTRLELELAPGQSRRSAHARFMLDAFDADAPATTSLLSSVNIPGIALGLADEGQVIYTAEPPPTKNESATLYRLQMSDAEALVTAKRTLPGRYGDVRLFGDVAYYIEQGEDSCTPGALHAIALDETLTQRGNTTLTGGNWRYRESDSDKLLLQGPNYDGYALFDTTQTPAILDEFQPASKTGEFVHIHDGELWSESEGEDAPKDDDE
jgi:hypothetical protein